MMHAVLNPVETEDQRVERWKNAGDKLDRFRIAESYTRLVKNLSGERCYVLAINAPFGTGKTFFLENWKDDLDNDPVFRAFYYSAWETDYAEHPFIPLIYKIYQTLQADNQIPKDTLKTFWDISKEFGSRFSKELPSLLVDEISKKVPLGQTVQAAIKTAGECVIDASVNKEEYDLSSEPFQAFKDKEDVLRRFKHALSGVIEGMNRDAVEGDNQYANRLVIVIDELERCRPSYAVELLECVKHLFDGIPGLVFVLGTDREQLAHAVGVLYGAGMDTDGYLRRFITQELSLPEPELYAYIDYLYDENELDKQIKPIIDGYISFGKNELVDSCKELACTFELSLREIYQWMGELAIIYKMCPPQLLIFYKLIASVSILKKCTPVLYNHIQNNVSDNLLQQIIDNNVGSGLGSDNTLENSFKRYCQNGVTGVEPYEKVKEISLILHQNEFNKIALMLEKLEISNVDSETNAPTDRYLAATLNYLTKVLELSKKTLLGTYYHEYCLSRVLLNVITIN